MTEAPRPSFAAEGEMVTPLLEWLRRTRRAPRGTEVRFELPWRGRRVDVATLTRSGSLSAFELKLGGFSRVLEQAIYNSMSFERSWIVVESAPNPDNVEVARREGIGIIQVGARAHALLLPHEERINPLVRQRLRQVFDRTGGHQIV
ncbi:hypothetical protein Back2_10910 [Nocardioides baekrokdamisoli]|uniref:Restriction endonuclease type IV Mrr domain-containing protein n=1 Tax=Nocardioides baekrokdamisoli TaxID=1804624 RepID=A0A3G9J027_9ACTN|nr:hypothetical protein [Nocardioides baekrokdamisoli]BBH16804.1 hypothetical protein Back2_10910 [Nocardioides baekrokdamisoli]